MNTKSKFQFPFRKSIKKYIDDQINEISIILFHSLYALLQVVQQEEQQKQFQKINQTIQILKQQMEYFTSLINEIKKHKGRKNKN